MAYFRTLEQQHKLLFDDILRKAETSLQVKHIAPTLVRPVLDRFEDLKRYDAVYFHEVVSVEGMDSSFLLVLLEKHLVHAEIKGHNTALARQETRQLQEVEPVLVFRIHRPFGRAYLRTETLGDKLEDLFSKTDIDFERYPRFSKNYYLTGDDPEAIKAYIPEQLIAALNNTPGMTVEIADDWAMLRAERNLSEDVMLGLIGLGLKITKQPLT